MVDLNSFRKIALSFPEATEQAHFEKSSFRIRKKIFATIDEKEQTITVKLSGVDQDVFCTHDKSIIYPVPNKWGKKGWTTVELKKVSKELLTAILKTAYRGIAPKKLAKQIEDGL